MNVSYPLSYLQGSLKSGVINMSRVRHLLDTIMGERLLFPDFGVPLELLYSTALPQLFAERIRLAIALNNIQSQVTVKEIASGTLTLEIKLATGDTLLYATPAS
jgi:phage baseplate assembly protein W